MQALPLPYPRNTNLAAFQHQSLKRMTQIYATISKFFIYK